METLVRHGQTVNKMYEAFNKGDIPFIISKLHTDAIIECMGQPDIPYAGIYHGKNDVKQFFDKMNDQVEWKEFVTEHILENGNIVIATGYAKGTARKTKKLLSSIWSMIFEFNDEGKVVHLRDCFDTNAFAKAFTK